MLRSKTKGVMPVTRPCPTCARSFSTEARVAFAVDQQPWLQGYQAVDTLANYLNNRSILGGGQPILTGPSFIDKSNIDQIASYAQEGIR